MAISGVITHLWFDDQALEAAESYVAMFPDSRITSISHYPEDGQRPSGSVLLVEFELFGQSFAALNGGPQFPHTEAISFQVRCDTQEELDRVWDALVAHGGEESMCGWCKDRFGVSWQVVPASLGELMQSDSAPAVWQALMSMRRIDLATLQAAAAERA